MFFQVKLSYGLMDRQYNLLEDDVGLPTSGNSTAVTTNSSSSYYASSSGWTQHYQVTTREHDVTDRDNPTV